MSINVPHDNCDSSLKIRMFLNSLHSFPVISLSGKCVILQQKKISYKTKNRYEHLQSVCIFLNANRQDTDCFLAILLGSHNTQGDTCTKYNVNLQGFIRLLLVKYLWVDSCFFPSSSFLSDLLHAPLSLVTFLSSLHAFCSLQYVFGLILQQ